MNTVKVTRPIAEEPISKTAANLFAEFFTTQEREIKRYSRTYIEPIFATNESYKVIDYVLPFDPEKVEVINKTYEINGNKVTIKFKTATYQEVDSQGRVEYVNYLVPLWDPEQAMKSRAEFHRLACDIEPVSFAERIKIEPFQDLDIRDVNGQALVGYALAEELLGIPTGNPNEDARRNEVSSVKRINHASIVMHHERRRELYSALAKLLTNDGTIKQLEEVDNLSKLGVDSFTVSNNDTVGAKDQAIIQGVTGGRQVYNPGQYIRTDLDSSIAGTAVSGVSGPSKTFTNPNPQPGPGPQTGGKLKTKK